MDPVKLQFPWAGHWPGSALCPPCFLPAPPRCWRRALSPMARRAGVQEPQLAESTSLGLVFGVRPAPATSIFPPRLQDWVPPAARHGFRAKFLYP